MECISYLKDLEIEIETLNKISEVSDKKDEILDLIDKKKKALEKCKDNLSKLSSKNIEYRIYVHMLNGMTATQAVEKVAEENYINDIKPFTPTAIWKKYYKNLKKILQS